VTEVTEEVVAAMARLVPQLAPAAEPPSRERLAAIAEDPRCALLIARDPEIVGTLTLVAYPLPSGGRVWIEDVVVDDSARGRGVGEALVKEALARARAAGARAVDLTSRPAREAANRLYRRAGFTLRDTNAYRYFLDG